MCRWGQQASNSGGSTLGGTCLKNYRQNAKCNFHLPMKLKIINTWCTSTCISITYFKNQGNSHVSQNQNQTNVTIFHSNNIAEGNIT